MLLGCQPPSHYAASSLTLREGTALPKLAVTDWYFYTRQSAPQHPPELRLYGTLAGRSLDAAIRDVDYHQRIAVPYYRASDGIYKLIGTPRKPSFGRNVVSWKEARRVTRYLNSPSPLDVWALYTLS